MNQSYDWKWWRWGGGKATPYGENLLNDLESDPTNETDLNKHSLNSVEIIKSTDKETMIKLSKFISLCFEKRSKCLEARNADSQ